MTSIILLPLKKGWAKGSREQLLDRHIPTYTIRQNEGFNRTKEYVGTITNEYFAIYGWELPLTEEPTSVPVLPHLDNVPAEKIALKAATIAQITMVHLLDFSLAMDVDIQSRLSSIGLTTVGSIPR